MKLSKQADALSLLHNKPSQMVWSHENKGKTKHWIGYGTGEPSTEITKAVFEQLVFSRIVVPVDTAFKVWGYKAYEYKGHKYT